MRLLLLKRVVNETASQVRATIRMIFADTILCAICIGLYGTVIVGFGAQARAELVFEDVVVIGLVAMLVGGATGALVAILRETWRAICLERRRLDRLRRNKMKPTPQPPHQMGRSIQGGFKNRIVSAAN